LPQQELPVDFKTELHEKLLAIADRQDSNVRSIRKSKGFLFTKTFASIAAGMLLIFLVGSFYKYGLLSSMKTEDSTNNAALAAENPQVSMMDALGDSNRADKAGVAAEAAKSFSSSAPNDAGSFEIDRSASVQNRETALAGAGEMQKIETANSKLMTITINADEPEIQAEKVKILALEKSGDLTEKSAYRVFNGTASSEEKDTVIMASMAEYADGTPAAQLNLDFIIPETQYEQFITALNTTFGEANVQIGAFVTEDVTDNLNSNIAKSNEYDNQIQDLQKKDNEKSSDEIKKIKEEKEIVDNEIEQIRLGTDFVNVTVLINRK
jgi:hypothetical protein